MCRLKNIFLDLFFKILRYFADLIACIYSSIFYPDKKNCIPPIEDEILLLSAKEIAEKIRSGTLKCEKVVEKYLKRIEEVNKFTNSVVQISPFALEEAKKIDELVEQTKDKEKLLKLPLLGVPFTAKDSVCIERLKVTVGLVCRKDKLADKTSDVVINLRNAGAVPIAITNTPELLIWWDAHNMVTGRTNNPYDLSRIPGGSTGGCAALVASGASVLSLASDIGGSTRIPASFCGLFGHKTTSEVISSKGKYPEIKESKKHLFSFGPICRYSCDLRTSIYAMAGKKAIDEQLPKLFDKVDFSKITIYYMFEDKDPFKTPVHEEIKLAIKNVVKYFEVTHLTNTKEIYLPEFKDAFKVWSCLMSRFKENSFAYAMSDFHEEINLFSETIKSLLGLSEHTRAAIIFGLFNKFRKSDEVIEKYCKLGEQLSNKFHQLLGEDAVFLYPTHPEVAPKHGTTILKAHNTSYTSIFNILNTPVTQCPIQLSGQTNMPIGIQVAAAPYQDHLTLSLAEELEKAFGGWKPPCKINV